MKNVLHVYGYIFEELALRLLAKALIRQMTWGTRASLAAQIPDTVVERAGDQINMG